MKETEERVSVQVDRAVGGTQTYQRKKYSELVPGSLSAMSTNPKTALHVPKRWQMGAIWKRFSAWIQRSYEEAEPLRSHLHTVLFFFTARVVARGDGEKRMMCVVPGRCS